MHVRQLHLQGFKTFASRTAFEFDRGITAIVGPNGSGKSNLADALRWVLGEQSYSTLRSRRTEDVIFSGSSARSPMGMAEVSLLLDNEDGYLPIEFPELEITRRAYRSGVNEYRLNRRRVRLQDIEEVLGGLTSSYVVIHQGLVDEALSLRPRERRILLEEAAEVRRYHERRQKAQERLERTEANMTRISDLRAELTPRLRVLERQSQQARQRAEMEASLHQALRSWYRLLWEEGATAREKAIIEERKVQTRLDQARAALEKVSAEAARLRQVFQGAQRQQEEWRQQEVELRRQEAEVRRQLAQVEGEQRALQRYHEELRAEITHWQEEAARQKGRHQAIEAGRTALGQRLDQAQADLQAQEESYHQAEASLQALHRECQDLQQQLHGSATRAQEIESRLGYLATRAEALSHEQAERSTLLQGLQEQAQRVQAEKDHAEAALARLEATQAELQASSAALCLDVEQAQEAFRRATVELQQARLRLAEARARLEALSRSGAPGDGAAFLQEWARHEGKPPLASPLVHLAVPAELEAAVEGALGAEAADLLMCTWEDGRRALQALQAAAAGRATLLPQDGLRPPATDLPQQLRTESEGLLLDCLLFPEEDRAALTCLLGRVLLASDLEAARRIAHRLPAGWAVVTRQGELVTAEGLLRGGHLPPGHGVLARERECQVLAQAVAAAEAACREQEEALATAQQRRATAEEAWASLNGQLEEQRRRQEEGARQVQELARELAQIEEESARYRQRLSALDQEKGRFEEERATLLANMQDVQANQAGLQEQLRQGQQAEQAAQERYNSARDLLQEARTALAVARKERESQQALEEMAQQNSARLEQQIAEGEQRLGEALDQVGMCGQRAATLRGEIGQIAGTIAVTLEAVGPVSIPLDELARCDEEVARGRQDLLEAEGAAARVGVEVQRQEDHLKEVLRRGVAEIGPEASAYGPASEAFLNALLEDPPEWARAPLVPALSAEELERRIAHLREEARRIGPVNPLAEEEYRQARERYEFLGQQLQDMHDAVRSLEQVITELDQAMEERFQETFEAISREFQGYFARLFGGGTASLRLVKLEEEENGGLSALGVEIVARPPGKRAHSLALLSGGERALTSAALLFAILKVNPRPFCLLDEVDATLDEANVGRFRECLEELAAQTQFIVITHNRGTIEAAHTLYGVSMAEDGTSRVLSLRLEEVEQR